LKLPALNNKGCQLFVRCLPLFITTFFPSSFGPALHLLPTFSLTFTFSQSVRRLYFAAINFEASRFLTLDFLVEVWFELLIGSLFLIAVSLFSLLSARLFPLLLIADHFIQRPVHQNAQ